MSGKHIEQPNPPPDPSLVPDFVLNLGVQLDHENYLSEDELKSLEIFKRAANYIAAGNLYARLSAPVQC